MNKISAFSAVLCVLFLAALVYTLVVISREGMNFADPFISSLLSVTWSGQFNLDFLCYLMLSGLYVMWRGRFRASAVLMGALCMVLGILVFAPYLLYIIAYKRESLLARSALPGQGRV
jgi:NADH:ubiquinone oxidoreductase subunit 2 (subunit N)